MHAPKSLLKVSGPVVLVRLHEYIYIYIHRDLNKITQLVNLCFQCKRCARQTVMYTQRPVRNLRFLFSSVHV